MDGLFDIVQKWGDTGPLEDVAGTTRLKRRVVAGRDFQFKKADIRTRTKMGTEALRVAAGFKAVGPLIAMIASANAEIGENISADQRKALIMKRLSGTFMKTLPDVIAALGDDSVSEFVFSLCEHASIHSGDKYKPLKDPVALEEAFGDDLTLQVPVALSVLEVNLAEDFFGKIAAVFQ